jgi:hypothetical protein
MLWSKISLTGRDISSHGMEVRLTEGSLACFGERSADLGERLASLGVGIRQTGESLACFGAGLANWEGD